MVTVVSKAMVGRAENENSPSLLNCSSFNLTD